jgi:hypothetical protein
VAQPLGHLLIEFNALELDLGRLIARLLDQNEDVIIAIIGAQLMFSAKLKLARALVEAKVEVSKRQNYLDTLKTAEKCNRARNGYIHSEYVPYVDDRDEIIEVLRIPHRTRPRLYGDETEIEKFTPDLIPIDLVVLIEEIQAVGLEIRTLAERYWDNREE